MSKITLFPYDIKTHGYTVTVKARLINGELNRYTRLILRPKKWRTLLNVPFTIIKDNKEVGLAHRGEEVTIQMNLPELVYIDHVDQIEFYRKW